MPLALVLHAHLPYVRDSGARPSLEERWLHEATIECYLPLYELLVALEPRASAPLLTLSVSPTLASMWLDERHRRGLLLHVRERLALLDRLGQTRAWSGFKAALDHHRALLERARASFEGVGRELFGAFVELAKRGVIELCTTATTHGFLPNLPEASVRAQLRLGRRHHAELSGQKPTGFWLPECGYVPRLDLELARAGVGYTVLEAHGVELARPRPPHGDADPILSPSGVAYLPRDAELARLVWSREEGYPGDAHYREFHRDVGFEADARTLGDAALGAGKRASTGIKPWAVTGSETKRPYDPERARARAAAHAEHFLGAALRRQNDRTTRGGQGLLVAAFDAELFGHFWHEGPAFLSDVLELSLSGAVPLELVTPSSWLRRGHAMPVVEPETSTWGDGGYAEVWANPATAHFARLSHRAERRVLEIDAIVRDRPCSAVARRARLGALRELLLLESSDWAFIQRAGDYGDYGDRRAAQHASAVDELCAIVDRDGRGEGDEQRVRAHEQRTRLLPALHEDAFADALDPW